MVLVKHRCERHVLGLLSVGTSSCLWWQSTFEVCESRRWKAMLAAVMVAVCVVVVVDCTSSESYFCCMLWELLFNAARINIYYAGIRSKYACRKSWARDTNSTANCGYYLSTAWGEKYPLVEALAAIYNIEIIVVRSSPDCGTQWELNYCVEMAT